MEWQEMLYYVTMEHNRASQAETFCSSIIFLHRDTGRKTEKVAQPQASQTAHAPWATETGATAVQSRTGRHLLEISPEFPCNDRGQLATILARKYRTKTEKAAQPQASQTAHAPWATETGATAVQSRTGRHLL